MAFRPPIEVAPVTLTGSTIRLEPLLPKHAPDLADRAKPEFFQLWPTQPQTIDEAGLAKFIDRYNSLANVVPFAMVRIDTNEAIGMTTYMDIRGEHLGLEIGSTWIAVEYQRTRVNPEAKLLMLAHAFEVLGFERVQLKTDFRNLQSRAALRKLGACEEGVLRHHMQMPDGYMRDTVMFSIVQDEWPGLKQRLLLRLA
jgi:RimJ/RimL family protein N-acetyltransferase